MHAADQLHGASSCPKPTLELSCINSHLSNYLALKNARIFEWPLTSFLGSVSCQSQQTGNIMRPHHLTAKFLKPVLAACLLLLFGSQLLSAQIYFFDGNFSAWSFTNSGSGGGSGTMSLQASGGNPGACLNATTMTGTTHTGSGITESAWGIGVDPNWTTSQPLNGTQFVLGFDVIAGAGSFGQGQSVGLIVQQGTACYLDIVSTPITGFETSWTAESFNGSFDATNFRLQTGTGPSHPDFSGATATTFGFTAFNGDSGNLTQYYDNISLTVAPEPSTCTVGLGFTVFFAFVSRYRRAARNSSFKITT